MWNPKDILILGNLIANPYITSPPRDLFHTCHILITGPTPYASTTFIISATCHLTMNRNILMPPAELIKYVKRFQFYSVYFIFSNINISPFGSLNQ